MGNFRNFLTICVIFCALYSGVSRFIDTIFLWPQDCFNFIEISNNLGTLVPKVFRPPWPTSVIHNNFDNRISMPTLRTTQEYIHISGKLILIVTHTVVSTIYLGTISHFLNINITPHYGKTV